MKNLSNAEQKVIQERRNHKFNSVHDDFHLNGELEKYAIYLLTGDKKYFPNDWEEKWKYRESEGNHYKNIIQAASLLIAELDRRDRAKQYFTDPL